MGSPNGSSHQSPSKKNSMPTSNCENDFPQSLLSYRRCMSFKNKLERVESRWRRSSRLRLLRVAGDQLNSLSKDCKHLQIQREIEEKKNSNSRKRKSTTFCKFFFFFLSEPLFIPFLPPHNSGSLLIWLKHIFLGLLPPF